jgi:hypothetical protein
VCVCVCTIMEGRLMRAIAIKHPGMFLSQPGSEMLASYHCALITVSMLSAMISLYECVYVCGGERGCYYNVVALLLLS